MIFSLTPPPKTVANGVLSTMRMPVGRFDVSVNVSSLEFVDE